MLIVVAAPVAMGQIAAIVLGAIAGLVLCRDLGSAMVPEALAMPVSRRAGAMCLALFALLLLVPPLLRPLGIGVGMFDAFYRSGALVFGGGHVVLPLLRDAVVAPGWVTDNAFLAGYGVTQAMPGPVFTFAAYLGAIMAACRARFGAGRDLPAGPAADDRRTAVLGRVAHAPGGAGGDARDQCRGRRRAGRGALQPGMDHHRADTGRFRAGPGRDSCAADGLGVRRRFWWSGLGRWQG